MEKLDDIDRAILRALQDDASDTIAELAERAGVSQTPCWKRIKRLEKLGVIKKRVALLDANAIGLPLVGYIRIRTNEHNQAWLDKFSRAIQTIPEVTECHRMSGDVDYLVKVVVSDVADYDRVYKKLISTVDMAEVSASFSMERLKETTQLPI
ncbi:MAG: Lrp/AsnC family transcriptional regulator [Sphingomonadales bacterium]